MKKKEKLHDAIKLLVKNNFWINKHGFDIVKDGNEFCLSEEIGGEIETLPEEELDKLVELFLNNCS